MNILPQIVETRPELAVRPPATESPALELVARLCRELAAAGIDYCHWKSNNALDRSANGKNDLDLLVGRADMQRFLEILTRLGFKAARPPAVKQVPGVFDYLGWDAGGAQFVHVHAHDQLVLGHDLTKNYRLPIEAAYLASATPGKLFRVPAPEFEYIVLIVRLMLKHATWDTLLGGEGQLKPAELAEIEYLEARLDPAQVEQALQQHLPYIGSTLLAACRRALRPGCSFWQRARTGQRLLRQLEAQARRPWPHDMTLKLGRRLRLALRRRLFRSPGKFTLENGGALIAILGGDGAGKSTAIAGLHAWLWPQFDTRRVHMGKPRWSLTTLAVRGGLMLASRLHLAPPALAYAETQRLRTLISPETAWMLRQVCTARDRWRAYVAARRWAARGALVLLDRFPHPRLYFMDGPQGRHLIPPERAGRLVRRLIALEESYYAPLAAPELAVLLRVDPHTAVQRKTDEKPAYVLARSQAIWQVSWEGSGVQVIEAGQPQAAVLADIQVLVWSQL